MQHGEHLLQPALDMEHQNDLGEVSAAKLLEIARKFREFSVNSIDDAHALEAQGFEIKGSSRNEDGSETFTLQARGDQASDGRPEGERARSPTPVEVELVSDDEDVMNILKSCANGRLSVISVVDNKSRASGRYRIFARSSDREMSGSKLIMKYWICASLCESFDNYKRALDFWGDARRYAEIEKCQCEDPLLSGTQFNYAVDERGHRVPIFCPIHNLLPAILLQQARLLRQYWSSGAALETLMEGFQLTSEDRDRSVNDRFEADIVRIQTRQSNITRTFYEGDYSLSASDLPLKLSNVMQKCIDRRQSSSGPGPDPVASWYDEYILKRCEVDKRDDRVDWNRLLQNSRKCLGDFQSIDPTPIETRHRHLLLIANLDIIACLDKIGGHHREMKESFNEAVRLSKLLYSSVDQDIDALYHRLYMASFASKPAINEYEMAEVLFKEVIGVLEKKLRHLASMSEEHALRFQEMHKHAYETLTYTYYELATRHALKEPGSRNYAGPKNEICSENELRYVWKSLLWAERSKGRLLAKLLDPPAPTSTPPDRVPTHPSPRSKGFSETLFQENDDWAMDYLFRGEKFPHHVSKMLFIVYTMTGTDRLLVFVVDGENGTIGLFTQYTVKFEDEDQRLAKYEMENLVQGLQNDNSKGSIPSSLYAMNTLRTKITNFSITGTVARIHRLASEAQSNRSGNAICEKTAEINRLFVKLHDVLLPAAVRDYLREEFERRPDLTIVFVPHEDLSVVPFSALRDQVGEDGKCLIERYPICVSPSMWLTRHCQHLYYEKLCIPTGPELLVGRVTGYPKPKWKDLRKAHEEIASVREMCGRNAIEVLDSLQKPLDPSEKPMKDRVLEHAATASWAHFAVHGEVSSEYPQGSLLLGDKEMHRLTPDEIITAGSLCARSVVLSACQSGLGTLGGEGVLGFARGLVRAGVPSCVLSMWNVHETFCLEFMQQLYKHLHDGDDLAHAMQKSTVFMMKKRREPRPNRPHEIPTNEPKWLVLDWAAFTCIGYPGVKLPRHSDDEKRLYEESFRRPLSVRNLGSDGKFVLVPKRHDTTRHDTTPTGTQAQLPSGPGDLAPFIEWHSMQCLNENPDRTFANALKDEFKENSALFLESAADNPQLLLTVYFGVVVKLHSLMITGPPANGPRSFKLFVNKTDMDFDNATKDPATDTVVVSLENLKGNPIPLIQVKFQQVRSVTLFIEDNQEGCDLTQLQKLVFIGNPV